MYNPTGFLRAALPAALEAGKAILEIYAQPTEGWEIEEDKKIAKIAKDRKSSKKQ